jgi:hypothetical protein
MDVFSMQLGIRLSFVKTSEFQGEGGINPHRYTTTQEETLSHILCGCKALASLRHAYLGSLFLGPEDIKNASLGDHLELW